MQALFDFIFSNIRTLIPLTFIYTPQQGVFYRAGRARRNLEPGIHFRIPYYDNISIHIVTYTMVNLPTQSYLTSDKQRATFSANIGYVITDSLAMESNVNDIENSLANFAMGWMATQVNKRTFEDIVTAKRPLESGLEAMLNRRVQKWGVVVQDVAITDFTDARAYRLFQTE